MNRPTDQPAEAAPPAQTFLFPPPLLTQPPPLTQPSTLAQPPPLTQPPLLTQPPPITRPLPLTHPPPVSSFNRPPPPICNPRAEQQAALSLTRSFLQTSNGQKQGSPRPTLTKPPQRQSFLCHNPSLRVAGITPLSQPTTTTPRVSVSQDSGYISSSTNTSIFSDLGGIKVSVDNNLFTPEKVSRKRKSEPEQDSRPTHPLKDEGVELVLANFAEGTSGADIFKLLDPFKVAGVNMAVNKLTPSDDFTYSFVRFSSRREAEEAIQQLDGKPLLNSNQIVLEFA